MIKQIKINCTAANSVYNQLLGGGLRAVSLWVTLMYLIQNPFGDANDHTRGRCAQFLKIEAMPNQIT
jgi:hypothetical protein